MLGVTVPQANTTVEPEMQALLGAHHTLLTARMVCQSADSRERLLNYLDTLGETVAQFDVAPLQALGFACTGSSYLVGAAQEAERLASLRTMAEHRLPIPVVSSNLCLAWAMQCAVQPDRSAAALLSDMLAPNADWRRRL